MDFGERASDAVLDEVVGRDRISRQLPRITSQSRDQCLNVPVQGIVRDILLARTGPPSGFTTAIMSFRIGSLGLHIHDWAPSFSIRSGEAGAARAPTRWI
jgi:hypothetical protein